MFMVVAASANCSRVARLKSGRNALGHGGVLDHRRVNVCRMHRVDPDIMRCKLFGEAAHETDDTVLRRGVVRDPTRPRRPAMELVRMIDPAPRAMRCGAVPARCPYAGQLTSSIVCQAFG